MLQFEWEATKEIVFVLDFVYLAPFCANMKIPIKQLFTLLKMVYTEHWNIHVYTIKCTFFIEGVYGYKLLTRSKH